MTLFMVHSNQLKKLSNILERWAAWHAAMDKIMINTKKVKNVGSSLVWKKIIVGFLLLAVPFVMSLSAGDKVIAADAEHFRDIKITKGNVRIGEDADVMGNIFIDEGNLYMADDVDIVGSITIKKGNIFIKDNVDVTKTVTVKNGNITMANNNDIHADIVCKNGIVTMGSNNDIMGNVYAKELKRGRNSDIQGKFVKSEPK